MKKSDYLILFWGGLIMMAVGLFFFSQKVIVSNSFWGGGMYMRGIHVNSGLVVVPLIISLIWLFLKPGKLSKTCMVLSVILIIASVIMSTRFYIQYISLFEWVLMLGLIFGGGALAAKGILAKG